MKRIEQGPPPSFFSKSTQWRAGILISCIALIAISSLVPSGSNLFFHAIQAHPLSTGLSVGFGLTTCAITGLFIIKRTTCHKIKHRSNPQVVSIAPKGDPLTTNITNAISQLTQLSIPVDLLFLSKNRCKITTTSKDLPQLLENQGLEISYPFWNRDLGVFFVTLPHRPK